MGEVHNPLARECWLGRCLIPSTSALSGMRNIHGDERGRRFTSLECERGEEERPVEIPVSCFSTLGDEHVPRYSAGTLPSEYYVSAELIQESVDPREDVSGVNPGGVADTGTVGIGNI